MRIVFISSMSSSPWGGSEELWGRTAARLAEEGHQVGASVKYWPQLAPKVAAMPKQGINLFLRKRETLPRLHKRLLLRMARKLGHLPRKAEWRWLEGQKPELVVISQGQCWDGFEWMEYCRENKIPFVSIIQANFEALWPDDVLGEKLARMYGAARRVFCVSRHNLDLLRRQIGAPLPNGEVVWNPVNLEDPLACDWPRDNGVWKLACVARLEPSSKGQDILLQALGRSQWRDRPVEVDFYGTGDRERSLRKLAESLDLKQVHFRGHIDDIQAMWRQHHLLVLPSRHEGLPLVLVEAMRCGRPALVTDVGGNAEVCIDGQTGFVVPAPTPDLFEEGLERAWQRRSDWKQMGEAARQHINALVPFDPVGEFSKQLLKIHAHCLHQQ